MSFPPYTAKLLGYCEIDATALRERLQTGGSQSLINLKGDYCWILESEQDCYIITSPYGACQYYYTLHQGQFFHGETVLDVLEKSGLAWSWNWRALADFSFFDHTLERDTLHSEVWRVPPGSCLHFCQGKLHQEILSWDELNPPEPSSARTALDRFNQGVQEWLNDPVAVSLSGGFDSRLILASVLKAGVKPFVFTMGNEESTDVMISRQIAHHFQLDYRIVQLNFADYFPQGKYLARLTNGTKAIRHWHTYFYPHYAQVPRNHVVYIGTNGEFAKNFYYDKGILLLYQNWAAPVQALRQMWAGRLRYGTLFQPSEFSQIHPGFVQELSSEAQAHRIDRLVELSNHRLCGGLEQFYVNNRVQNFMGNGLKLYAENLNVRLPFMNREWMRSIWNLNYRWRLGNNWHRFAIEQTLPALMNFAEQGETTDRLRRRAPFLYWRSDRKKLPVVSFGDRKEWFRSSLMVEFLHDQAEVLRDLMDPNLVKTIALENQEKGNRFLTVSFLATQIFWNQCVQTSKKAPFSPDGG